MTENPLEQLVIKALRKVHDPEIPVNIYDLGLIYELVVEGERAAITMTLTAPNCPVADNIVADVRKAAESVESITDVAVELVFDPPWTTEKMSEIARLSLDPA